MSITINDRRPPLAAAGLTRAGETDMNAADEVMVQPTTTYMEGAEHKNERSDPYPVPRWHGEELKAQGFARIVGDAAQTADAGPDPAPVEPAPTGATAEPATPPIDAPKAAPSAASRRNR